MIVDPVRRHPGQTIAAVHATGLPFAQRAAPVVEIDLRHRPEGELSRRSEQEGARDRGRGDPQPDEIGERASAATRVKA